GALHDERLEQSIILRDDETHDYAMSDKNRTEANKRTRCRAVDGARNSENSGRTSVRSRLGEPFDAIGGECHQALFACFQEVVAVSGGYLDLHVTSFWNLLPKPLDTVRYFARSLVH